VTSGSRKRNRAGLRVRVRNSSESGGWKGLIAPRGSQLRRAAGRRWRPFGRRADEIEVEDGLEKLTIDESLRFLRECRLALRKNGTLTLRTPNLDWVFQDGCRMSTDSAAESVEACLRANLSFRRDGIQFLYNDAALGAALREAGFARVSFESSGEVRTRKATLPASGENGTSPHPSKVLLARATGRGPRMEVPRSLFSDMTQTREWRIVARLRAVAGRLLRRAHLR
jgi:hypothetical protein